MALILIAAIPTLAREPDSAARTAPETQGDAPRPFPKNALLAFDSIPLASYSFDDGIGGPDPMGWTTVDFTLQPDTFFHVDDFASLGGGAFGGLNPLEGAQSLWCGSRPSPDLCYYASLPGYGHGWNQQFTSIPLGVTGDVTVTFLARFDSETDYDQTSLDYWTQSGRWQNLAYYNEGPSGLPTDSLVSETILADSLSGSIQFRFRFTSDGAWDDEDGIRPSDGAVLIDSLTVTDVAGLVDYQDFESESTGALATADGHWAASVPTGFGDHAALFDGTTVLQEDTVATNTSYLWGFFLNSPDVFDCEGHPEQPVVPLATANGTIDNAAVSPVIDITSLHIDGALPDSTRVLVAYDVYKHSVFPFSPFSTYVRETVRVRALVNGCWSDWFRWIDAGGTGQWARQTVDLTQRIDPSATHIQVALGAVDIGAQPCHTHAPLIDNVSVYALAGVATAIDDRAPGPDRLTLYQNYPNPFNPSTLIRFDVSSPGARVSLRVYDVSGRLVRILHDGITSSGPHAVTWDGTNLHGQHVSSGVYFYRLETPTLTRTRKMVLLK